MGRKKVEVEPLRIFDNRASGASYVLVMGERGGRREFPIIVGTAEAQSLITQVHNLMPQRPTTHMLFSAVLEALGVSLLRALIYKVERGVFYSYIYLKVNETILRVDSRISDAVIMALRMNAPIFIYEEILDSELLKTGMGSADPVGSTAPEQDDQLQEDTVTLLTDALQRAVAAEDYELAARLRDQLTQQKKKLT